MTSARRVALLRGINVGKAKRVAMADLRALVEGLGYRDVSTLLNSGNVVFTVPATTKGDAAARIERAMTARLGVSSRVTVLTAAELATVMAENPLVEVATDPSRYLVGVLAAPADRKRLAPLVKQDWAPEALAVGARAAYLWVGGGILASRLFPAIHKALGDAVTTRNWTTMSKLAAIVASD